MWRNDDLYRGLVGKHEGIVLPVAPCTQHGLFSAIAALIEGGTVVLLEPRASPALVWGTFNARGSRRCHRRRLGARPLLPALDAGAGTWDLSALGAITSSGQGFSPEIRRRLLTLTYRTWQSPIHCGHRTGWTGF